MQPPLMKRAGTVLIILFFYQGENNKVTWDNIIAAQIILIAIYHFASRTNKSRYINAFTSHTNFKIINYAHSR